jgi:hypothetical protein
MASFPTESGGGGQTPGQRKSPSSVEMRLRPSIPAYERHVNIESAARCRLGEGTDVSQAEHVALHAAIATRGGYCWWDVDHAGWVVTLRSPGEQTFNGKTLEEAMAWCLVSLMAPEIGIGPFLV